MLFDWRTVAKNISLPLEMLGWSRAKRTARVGEMLELVELTGFENHHPWQLSGGMQQRVSIARALSFSPALVLMDEPFGALDEMTRERLNMELLGIWRETGSTIVFVTHSIAEAVFLSTRVVVMSARPGRITEVIDIDLPQPRTAMTREDPRFFELGDRGARGARPRPRPAGRDARGRRGMSAQAVEQGRGGALAHGARRRAGDWLPALIVFAIGIAAWEWIFSPLAGEFLLPKPSAISRALWDNHHLLWQAGWYTFKEALGGFVVGSGSAIVVALILARWRRVGDALLPYAIALSAVPIIAFAPITNAWFGVLNPHSKMAIAAILCFFPVLVNTLRGLTLGAARVDRADALLRREQRRGVPPRAHPGRAAAALRGPEGGHGARDDRRRRRRLLRRLDARARRADRELDLAVRPPVRLGGDRRRKRVRDRVLLRRRARGAARFARNTIDRALTDGSQSAAAAAHDKEEGL